MQQSSPPHADKGYHRDLQKSLKRHRTKIHRKSEL
jgi:hypothetical protein